MKELLKKEALLTIPYQKKKYIFLIRQASLEEIIEFDYYLQQENEAIVKYILILLKKLNPEFKDEIFHALTPEQYANIHKFFLKNYCTGFYETKNDTNQAKEKKDADSVEKVPFSAIIAGVLSNTNETLESLLKMTWEQIEYITEWLNWNANELTPKGKEENKKKQFKKEKEQGAYKETLEKLRANRAKINAKFINNQK